MKISSPGTQSILFEHVRYVFLDRDGVINRQAPEGEHIVDWTKFQILPGVEAAIAALNRAGRHVIVLTNSARCSARTLHVRRRRFPSPQAPTASGRTRSTN